LNSSAWRLSFASAFLKMQASYQNPTGHEITSFLHNWPHSDFKNGFAGAGILKTVINRQLIMESFS